MFLARVIRPLVASHKDASLKGRKLLVVQLADPQGQAKGATLVAIDHQSTHAGPGDLVLVAREGTGCREMMNDPQGPINAMICGVVDQVNVSLS